MTFPHPENRLSETDGLSRLKVVDRLEVEPARLERHRWVASYVIHRAGAAETFEFMYRFEEDVLAIRPPPAGKKGNACGNS